MPKSTQRRYRRETELAAADLTRLILKPAAGHLTKKRLLIVADGPLQYLPFAALPLPDSARGDQTLLARHEIISLPSASVLAGLRSELRGRKPSEREFVIFADPVFQADDPRVQMARAGNRKPAGANADASETSLALSALTRSAGEAGVQRFERLPFVRQEAEAITSLIPKQQQLKALDFTASRATALGSQLDKYRVIHFATHGLLNSRHPELSGVVLSLVDENGQPQDGFLRLNDLYNLKLNADLVVLSACSTALGKEIRGEGLISLTRGFMYAGAARVVASLWNVNDAATAELMKRFYRAMLVEKLAPAAALRAAQLEMSRDGRWSAPYYWSCFVLQGEWK
jgi:CHAT domain-containing protein